MYLRKTHAKEYGANIWGSIRSKPWIVETPKASKFTIVGRLTKDSTKGETS